LALLRTHSTKTTFWNVLEAGRFFLREPDPSLWRQLYCPHRAGCGESGSPQRTHGAGTWQTYTPTAAQRVKVPRGSSRKQEAEFLARDLEEALAREPTPEDLGESVIDLTGDALPCIEL
jgi:hypothetical protein